MHRRPLATLLMLAAITAGGWLTLIVRPLPPSPFADSGGDARIYRTVVSRLAEGTPYYTAIGEMLRHGRNPAKEVFHWRTPLFFSALAAVPESISRAVLLSLAAALVVATFAVTITRGGTVFWTAIAMQIGAVAMSTAVPDAIFMAESWIGLGIGLSVCAYILEWRTTAVLLGLASLFVRELAVLYCVICTLLALGQRRWRELTLWLMGAVLYAVYFGIHVIRVWQHQRPDDLSGGTWMALWGVPFLLGTIEAHGWMLLLPAIVTALTLALIIAGSLAPATPPVVRWTSIAYGAFFLIAGKSFNVYWGLVVWPTWALAVGYGVDAAAQDLRVQRGAATRPITPRQLRDSSD